MRAASRTGFSLPVVALVAVGCAIVGGFLGGRLSGWSRAGDGGGEVVVTPRGELGADEQDTIAVFEAAQDSVVFITTLQRRRANPFALNVLEQPKGTGSGFVWGDAGFVVTNFHVVAEGDAFRVALANNEAHDATLVGVDPSKDLAVLRIKTTGLRPLTLGTSADLRVGQKVFAIGNPFGLDHTLTTGVVSALGREIDAVNGRTIHDVIQTDAAINPGNSGGPLLDSAGRLIGVNTAIYSPSGASSGIGFAVPVDTVLRVVPQLIKHGRVVRPSLGVLLVPDPKAKRLGLPGPMISRVVPGGPADKAGLQGLAQGFLGRISLGDVILAVDGERVNTGDDLLDKLEARELGDTVVLRILRGGSEAEVQVQLSAAQ